MCKRRHTDAFFFHNLIQTTVGSHANGSAPPVFPAIEANCWVCLAFDLPSISLHWLALDPLNCVCCLPRPQGSSRITHTEQQHQCSWNSLMDTQWALMIRNPRVYPPDRFLVKTCIITHHISFQASYSSFLHPRHFASFASSSVSFLFCRLGLFFSPVPAPLFSSQNGLKLPPFSHIIVIPAFSELVGPYPC